VDLSTKGDRGEQREEGGEGGAREKKEERRKRAMTCSVISVLCIRLRLIYREPRRGTGCAPGAPPGPSHASALPAYPFSSPLPLLGSFSFWHAFLFAPVLPSFDLSERRKSLAVSFPLFLLLAFSLSFQEYFLNPLFFMFLFGSQCSLRNQHHFSTRQPLLL